MLLVLYEFQDKVMRRSLDKIIWSGELLCEVLKIVFNHMSMYILVEKNPENNTFI